MSDLTGFPDVHDVLKAVLADLCPNVVGPRLPSNLQDELPMVRVRRIGGSADRFTDGPIVDVETYAGTYPVTRDLAEAIRQRLMNTPQTSPAGSIDSTRVDVGPQEIPYADQTLRVVVATYRLSLRRSA